MVRISFFSLPLSLLAGLRVASSEPLPMNLISTPHNFLPRLVEDSVNRLAIPITDSLTTTLPKGVATGALQQAVGYVIDLSQVEGPPICSFATSGTWSTLPRIGFYLAMVFALLAHTHEWLIGGALGAALSYSSLAALQVIFQVWTERSMAELDLIPITGILGASCIIAVPLMNWSKTIQRLGLDYLIKVEKLQQQETQECKPTGQSLVPVEETRKTEITKKIYGPTRIILAFWSLLVATGFLSAFSGIQSYFAGASWINIGITLNNVTNPSGVSCMPANGSLDLTAGQLPTWSKFHMSREFLTQNNCNDPCSNVLSVSTLFRSPSELFALSAHSLSFWYEKTIATNGDVLKVRFVEDYFRIMLSFLPFILLQGAMHIVLFWRSSPQRARWRLYLWISGIQPEESNQTVMKRSLRTRFAFIVSMTFYLFALLILVISPIAFGLNVFATELTLHWIRQSESSDHVDQWGVFAITILVLIAAIICRLDPSRRIVWEEAKIRAKLKFRRHQIDHEKKACRMAGCIPVPQLVYNRPTGQFKKLLSHMVANFKLEPSESYKSSVYQIRDFWKVVAYEWHMLQEFRRYPHIKPKRREKMGPTWYLEKPYPRRVEDHREQEEKISVLKEDLRRAKEELADLRAMQHNNSNQGDFTVTKHSHNDMEALPLQNPAAQLSGTAVPLLSRSISDFTQGSMTNTVTPSRSQIEMHHIQPVRSTGSAAQDSFASGESQIRSPLRLDCLPQQNGAKNLSTAGDLETDNLLAQPETNQSV